MAYCTATSTQFITPDLFADKRQFVESFSIERDANQSKKKSFVNDEKERDEIKSLKRETNPFLFPLK